MFGKPRDATEIEALRAALSRAIEERDEARNTLSLMRPCKCSFCGKSQHDVLAMIAGPGEIFICDECVDLCVKIVKDRCEENAGMEQVTDEGEAGQ